MLLMFLITASDAGIVRGKKTVNITNYLGRYTDLTLHCKSKDNDLGEQHLAYKSYYPFRFRPSYWGKTQFFCFFKWEENNGTAEAKWFDIYIDDRDKDRCTVCNWRIQSDGPCLLDDATNNYDICFPWNP